MRVLRKRTVEGLDLYKVYKFKEGADLESFLSENPDFMEVTVDAPSMDDLEYWTFDGVAEATDGCTVEPDGVCPHGHPSWLLALGLI